MGFFIFDAGCEASYRSLPAHCLGPAGDDATQGLCCSAPLPQPQTPPGRLQLTWGRVGMQRKAMRAALTMVPMLYVAAGPMVWW